VDPFEYLVIRLLTYPSGFQSPRIQPFNVENISATLWGGRYRAPDCVILFSHPEGVIRDRKTGILYEVRKKWDHVSVWMPRRGLS